MIDYKNTESLTGGRSSVNIQRTSRGRRDTSPSDNGTNELVANLDHALLDVRVRAVKCLLRKLECGIVSPLALKDRVDLLDRCRRWLSQVLEGQNSNGAHAFLSDPVELEGVQLVVQLLFTLSKFKDFRDLLRRENVDSLLSKILPYMKEGFECQTEALLNSLVVGQIELSYEGSPGEWHDNKTCPPLSTRPSEMFSSRYKPYGFTNYGEDSRSPPFATAAAGGSDSTRTTPEQSLPKKSSIPLSSEDGWIQNIQFFVPSVHLSGTDKRVIHSTTDSLTSSNDSLVLMTVSFIRDTLTLDYPPELFIQESSLILSLAQITITRWSDRRIPYTAIQTLTKVSNLLRFRFSQLNSAEQYEVPTPSYDQKPSNAYYDYDTMSYSSRVSSKAPSAATAATDSLVENFIQLFKSFSRALHYTSYDLHIWPVFDNFAFTLFKCVTIFPVDSKALTLSLQSALMELSHIWERKSDYNTTVGLCLVCASILHAMKHHNETFIVSKDVRSMLRSLSYSSIIRNCWPKVFDYFIEFSAMYDPSGGGVSDQPKDPDSETSDDNPKKKLLKLLYSVQNASSHEEVLDSVISVRDVLLPISLNVRLGQDGLSYVLQDAPWRDTFYRFLCIEPTTEGDEDLLGHVLDLFTYILQNVENANIFKWITPLCCEKSCTTIKLLGNTALKKEARYGGTALPDILRSLIDFYSAALRFGNVLISPETKWELFQIYVSILHGLEQSSYSNFALLTAVSKELASITADAKVQKDMVDNPVVAVGLVHRITDAIIVLDANGSLYEGFKNSCCLYYLSICLVHVLIPVMKNENYENFRPDWIERCGRAFHIFSVSPEARVKAQAFQICEILTSTPAAKRLFNEVAFKESISSLLEVAYSAFVDQKHPSMMKFRAANVVLNILNDNDEKAQYSLSKRLYQGFAVLADLSRLSSKVLWNSKMSSLVKDLKSDKSSQATPVYNDGVPFITPRVLTKLCKILIVFLRSLLLESDERARTIQEVTTTGICQMMYRIILLHPLKTETNSKVWLEACCSVSTVVETLISLSRLDRTISIILIGEKKCLSMMFSLLELEIPSSANGATLEKAEEALSALCSNVLNLATILSCDAGNNFEDLERVAWSFQQVLFTKLTLWLSVNTPVLSKKSGLGFCQAFLSALSSRRKGDSTAVDEGAEGKEQHPFLCRPWKESLTYGQALSENLIGMLKESVDFDERMSAMKCLAALFSLSPSSVSHAVEDNDIVQFCVQKLHSFGSKFFEAKLGTKKNTSTIHTETVSFMELLSCIFYVSSKAKAIALKNNFPDMLHKIFAWWTSYPDLSLLHIYIEALLNFTEEFPQGALAMTMTSNVVGVGPRRVPTQQSLFIEILAILEKELANVENHPNLKTVEIIFELLKNICFVQECRNILLKSPIIMFLRRLHSQETKKWGKSPNTVKINYLDFLVHATAHGEVQTCIAKIPEGLEILIQLVDSDQPPSSTLALKVLRNLCFQASNRGRLLSENMFVSSLSNIISQSSDLEEIENASVSLWALIANYEKGRLYAKKSYCHESISKALERIRKLEQTSNTEQANVSRLITLLETVHNLLSSSGQLGSKLTINSRSSSSSYLP